MSRDVDMLCLWNDKDAQELNDLDCYRVSRDDYKNFKKEWHEFEELMAKYKVIVKEYITIENYKWLYAHLFSRCFGRRGITLAPYCDLFNHHISRVFYDHEYLSGNSYKYLETKCEKIEPVKEGE
jgi:hypothetical protein